MGRFSQVQAFADNHNAVRKVTYEQVSGTTADSSNAYVPPEKVVNPYGSTAGAGSGEFHVYRHARNRELQRQKGMELSAAEQAMDAAYQAQLEQNRAWEEERTAKRRKKRERLKNTKRRKQNLAKAGILLQPDGVRVASTEVDSDEEDDEFVYTPGEALKDDEAEQKKGDDDDAKVSAKAAFEIPNDGSFLDIMKKKLQQEPKEHVQGSEQEA
jgi:Protein of unknown function (DUF1168)